MPVERSQSALIGVDPVDFRRACGQFATGVTVVAAMDAGGPRGMTANSFTSVSLEPPMVMLAVSRERSLHRLLKLGRRFAVNVLAQEQTELADRFAGRGGAGRNPFAGVRHWLTPDGLPLIDGALAHLVCRLAAVHPAGDHDLFLREVEEVRRSPGTPLVFFAGGYRALDGRGA